MSPAFRLLAIAAPFALIAGYTCPTSLAADPSRIEEADIRHWSAWWMNEAARQTLPVPQLLFISSFHLPSDPKHKIGSICAPEEFEILNPFYFPGHHEWDQSNTGWLKTEACIMPSKLDYIRYPSYSYARLLLVHNEWLLPATGLKAPNEKNDSFSRLRNIRAFSTIAPTSFSTAQLEAANPFKLNTPERLSEYGDDLRLLEYSLTHTRNNPFIDPAFLVPDRFTWSWSLYFSRWSPPEVDEMFSTPLPPSP